MSATVAAELLVSFRGDVSDLDRAAARAQTVLRNTESTTLQTSQAMVTLALSTSGASSAIEAATIQAATLNRVGGDTIKVAGALATTLGIVDKAAMGLDSAMDLVIVGSKAMGTGMALADKSAADMGVSLAAAKVEAAGLGRTMGGTAATGYAAKLDAGALAATGLRHEVSLTSAQVAALNQLMTQSKTIGFPSASGAAGTGGRGRKADGMAIGVASSVGRGLTSTATLPIIAADLASAKFATDFSQNMANVDSIAKLTTDGLDQMSRAVLSLAEDKRITQGPNALATSLYDVVSSGYSGKKALDLVKEGAYGATAGQTSAAVSTKALTAVLNSHVQGIRTARQASDVLFRTVDLGVLTYEQLGSSIGKVLPTAAAAGVSLQEIGAAVSVMTRNGISGSESITSLNNLILHVAKPSKSSAEAMKELGISYGFAALQSKGLTGWLQQAIDKTHGNQQALQAIMPEMRGLRGLLSLANDGGKAYTQMLGSMDRASQGSGATQAALGRQLRGMGAQAALAKKDLEIAAIALGNDLIPAEKDAIGVVRELAQGFSHLDEGTRKTIVVIGLATAALGPVISIAAKAAGAVKTIVDLRATMIAAQGATALAGGAATGAAGGFAALSAAALPVVAILGTVALAGYGVYKAYEYLTGGAQRERTQMLDTVRARAVETASLARQAAGLSQNAGHTANLYRQYEILRDRTDRTKAESELFRKTMADLGAQNPSLVSAFDSQGRTVSLLAGQYANLAAEADRAGAAARRAANEARIASVQAQHTAPVVDTIAGYAQARYTEQAASTQLARLRTLGSRRVVSGRMDRNGDFNDQEVVYEKSGATYQAELARASAGVVRAQRAREAAEAARDHAQNEQRAAFLTSKWSDKDKADFMADDAYKPTPKGKAGGGGGMPSFGGGGGGGRTRAPKESQEAREADQLVQSLKDRVGNLSTAYLLLGKSADSAALRQEILGGEFAGAAGKAKALETVLAALRKRGALDFAAGDLFGKGTKFDSLQGTAKLKAEAYALQLVTEKRKANTEANKAQADALTQVQAAANQASREALASAATSDEDRMSLLAFGVPVSGLPGLIGKVRAKAYAAVYAQQAKAEKDKLANDYRPDADLFDNGAETAKENRAKRAQAMVEAALKEAENYRAIMDRLTDRKGEGDAASSLAARRAQYIREQVGDLKTSGNLFTDANRMASVVKAAGAAFDASPIRAYRDAIRGLTREFGDLRGQTDAARLASIRYDADGVERMGPKEAQKVLDLQKLLDQERAFRERSRQLGEASGTAFSDGLHAGLTDGIKKGIMAFLQSADGQIRESLVGSASKGLSAWVTRSMNRTDPNRPRDPGTSGGNGFWGGVGGAISSAMGGKNAALSANTTALNALTLKLATASLGGGAAGGAGGLGSILGLFGGGAAGASSLYSGAGSIAMDAGPIAGAGGFMPYAKGGHYEKGVPRLDGENGPEMDVPDHSGTIFPADLTARIMGAAKDGGSAAPSEVHHHHYETTYAPTFNVTGPVDRLSMEQSNRNAFEMGRHAAGAKGR